MLTAARVSVAESARDEYVAGVGELARLASGNAEHVWLFKRRGRPLEFLEFHERADGAPRSDQRFASLKDRLRQLARYQDDDIVWEEVR